MTKVSVVCPFYNESAIIEKAADHILSAMDKLPIDWELILVNDGSTDDSMELAKQTTGNEPRAKVIGYPYNKGRGYALKTGIQAATGEVIITTEIDLSWGETIIEDILKCFQENPRLEVVIASPNMPGGGYKNVPPRRVMISKLGNQLIRLLFTRKITMNTGMTRGYRREVIQNLTIDENGKEFHLEVLLKLVSLGHNIEQIPATLSWQEHKLQSSDKPKRKSSSKINKLILTHLNFAVFANPIRYFWAFSLLTFLGSFVFLLAAFYRFLTGQVAIYLAIVGLFLALFSLLFFAFGVISSQINKLLREMWRPKNNTKID